MNKTASEFLKKEDIIKPNHTGFWIQFEDGSQVELTEVLNRYHQEQLILLQSSLQLKEKYKTDFEDWILSIRYHIIDGIIYSDTGVEIDREEILKEYRRIQDEPLIV